MPIACSIDPQLLQAERQAQVQAALREDIGSGDITGQLVNAETRAEARVICREPAVLCGREWFDAVFAAIDAEIDIQWQAKDGDRLTPNQTLVTLTGSARSLLTGERCALNFLQTLSATATRAASYAERVADTSVKLLDTRKTLPGLRMAQKYAVACGGCHNHRIGLFDAFLIKENHIAACGGIAQAVARAHEVAPGKPVEVEVETLDELRQALSAGTERIMLDNFTLEDIHQAVKETAGRAELEVSGNITQETLLPLAQSGVDFLSIGDLTKSVQAIDLSMRLHML